MERVPMPRSDANQYREIVVDGQTVKLQVETNSGKTPDEALKMTPNGTPQETPMARHETKDTQRNMLRRVRKVTSYVLQAGLAAGVVNVAGHTAADALPFYSDPDGFRPPTSVENVIYDVKAIPEGSIETFNEFASLAEQVGDMGDDAQ